MHVNSISLDLNWFLQLVFTLFVLALGLRHLLKNTASKYFVVDASFDPSSEKHSSDTPSSYSPHSPSTQLSDPMPGVPRDVAGDSCAVCGRFAPKKCSRCKTAMYCSKTCQIEHWKNGHKTKCRPQSFSAGMKKNGLIALVPSSGFCKMQEQSEKVLFPYGDFVKLFRLDMPGSPPCGLLNCGNSCFANVVLQCLVHTRPLLAYLLSSGHKRGCRRNGWCFLCDLQMHAERASGSQCPFSPINILSRLPSLGGNLGYGNQEDAHEFMRFAIDTMQSICLDEHGGEKVLHLKSQATTLIQHIFGGQLQSQVICTQCKKVSNQFEYMMDLTVEIQGDATSLEECLDQFTAKEWLHGDNMYKCDRCDDYVKAWKRLSVHQAPNILTIALKRFQSGRFGKLNKRITFPENLDLSPYMSDDRDGTDKYELYAVVVHVDMLNASFFGHYICYTKDFVGNWYRVDDCKVMRVELDEVLSQEAYMLLYSRISARATCMGSFDSPTKQEIAVESSREAESDCVEQSISNGSTSVDGHLNSLPRVNSHSNNFHPQAVSSEGVSRFLAGDSDNKQPLNPQSTIPVAMHVEVTENGCSIADRMLSPAEHCQRLSPGSSLNEKSSEAFPISNGASISGSCVHSISIPENGQLARPIPMDLDSTVDGLTPDRISSVSSSGATALGRAVDKPNDDMPLNNHVEGRNDIENHEQNLRVNDTAEASQINGNSNEGQHERCVNDVSMDFHLNGFLDICEGEANGSVLGVMVPNGDHCVDMDVVFNGSVSVSNGKANSKVPDEMASDGGHPASTDKVPSFGPREDLHINNGMIVGIHLSEYGNAWSGEANGPRQALNGSHDVPTGKMAACEDTCIGNGSPFSF